MANKLKIKLVILGYFPNAFQIKKAKSWTSILFQITDIDEINIVGNSDGFGWVFLDTTLSVPIFYQ